MKVLFVATVRSHIGQFHMPFIRDWYAGAAGWKRRSRTIPPTNPVWI